VSVIIERQYLQIRPCTRRRNRSRCSRIFHHSGRDWWSTHPRRSTRIYRFS